MLAGKYELEATSTCKLIDVILMYILIKKISHKGCRRLSFQQFSLTILLPFDSRIDYPYNLFTGSFKPNAYITRHYNPLGRFTMLSERLIFENLFMAFLLTFRVFFRNLMRGSRRGNMFSYFSLNV